MSVSQILELGGYAMRPRATTLFVLSLIIILAMVFVPGVWAAPVLQGGDSPTVPEDLVVVLTNLTKAVGVGVVVSFLLKNPGWFKGMPKKTKWWLVFGLSIGLPIVAQLLLDFIPPQIWEVLNPYWKSLSMGLVGWAASQVAYEKVVRPALLERG